jgi:radical SAM protein with 4Fe4S-binding SPASM domain
MTKRRYEAEIRQPLGLRMKTKVKKIAKRLRLRRGYLDHIHGKGEALSPEVMVLMLNTSCNLRCEFCNIYKKNQELKLADCKKIIRDAKEIGIRHIVMTGGEPLLHRDFFDIVRYAKELGLEVNLTTNGMLVGRFIDQICDSNIDSVSVSIDGLEEIHDSLRRKKGAFSLAMQGVDLLCKRIGPEKVSLYFVVTNKNVMQLKHVYELARQKGTGFNFWPVNDSKSLYLKSSHDIKAYRAFIRYASRYEGLSFLLKRGYYRKGIDYHAEKEMRTRCLGLSNQFGIDVNGDLLPCCLWGEKELVIGNALETPIKELWDSEKASALRRKIFYEGCGNRCFNHSLYEFSQITGKSFLVRK